MWKSVIWPAVVAASVVASILSALCYFVSDNTSVIIALLVFCLSVIGFFVYLAFIINGQLKKSVYPIYVNANFLVWEFFEDGKKSRYEVYRYIQCKKPFLSEYDYPFYWTGSKDPVITSDLQRVDSRIKKGHKNEYDSIRLSFPNPLFYNDTAILHFKAELDDIDNSALPIAEFGVRNPISILHFRIILKYKDSDYNKSASLIRRPIDNKGPHTEEIIESVPFDKSCKSYDYRFRPEVGYSYKLKWEK